MTRVLCAISGVEFKVEHMQMYLTSRECSHPIFSVPGPALLRQTERWLEQELSPTENYLLYLSLFNCTGLVDFRSPAIITRDTESIIAKNMDHLASIVDVILSHGEDRALELFHMPRFAITPDTQDLTNSPEWIGVWRACYAEYCNQYRTATALEKLTKKETILERLIKDKTRDIATYAHQLASWAAAAGSFPEFIADLDDLSQFRGLNVSLSKYWQHIIKSCARTESIWEIPDSDLQELIEHCEEHIEHGSIYAHTLMSLLRAGAERKKNFLDLGDINIGVNGITFRILDPDASVEDANKQALILAAPIDKPVEKDYPNKLSYLKAKMNWQMAQDYKNQELMAEKIAVVNADYAARNNAGKISTGDL